MREILRTEIVDPHHLVIIAVECYHKHKIIKDMYGIIRWKPINRSLYQFRGIKFHFEIAKLITEGYTPKDDEYRCLYRQMGLSLDMYWQLFYSSI